MQLTTKTRYSIVFLLHLANAKENEFVGVYEVADKQCISAHYLDQLARKLRQANLVEPKKGPNGGYRLAMLPEDITLLDIFQAVGEQINFNLYDLSMRETDEVGAYEDYMTRITQLFKHELMNITLKNIMEKKYYDSCKY